MGHAVGFQLGLIVPKSFGGCWRQQLLIHNSNRPLIHVILNNTIESKDNCDVSPSCEPSKIYSTLL